MRTLSEAMRANVNGRVWACALSAHLVRDESSASALRARASLSRHCSSGRTAVGQPILMGRR